MNKGAIILASQNEKLINSDKPKVMCEILMQPILCRVISAVKTAGIEDICIVTDNDTVRKISDDGTVEFINSINYIGDFINSHRDSDILLINGSLPFADACTISSAMAFHKEKGNNVTAITVDGSIPEDRYALIFKADGFDGVFGYTGLSKTEKISFNTDNNRFFMAPDTYKQLNEINEALRIEMLEKLMDSGVDIPCKDGIIIGPGCKIGADTKILPNTIIHGNVTIGGNCVIGPNSYVYNAEIGNGVSFNNSQIKNAKIMNNADIGPFAHIRPDAVINDNVHLGNFTEVKNSVIDTGTKVSHLTYVGDSDVGKDVNFGCGVVTVNFTGKTKHRTVIKDNAFIGCNTNLVAPVTVGKNSYTAAGSTITEDVPDNTLALARERQINKEGWVKKKQPYRKKV